LAMPSFTSVSRFSVRICQNLSLTCLLAGKPIHFTAFDCHQGSRSRGNQSVPFHRLTDSR
jgi:hypothetical protein